MPIYLTPNNSLTPNPNLGTRCKRMCLTFNIAIIFTSLVTPFFLSYPEHQDWGGYIY